MKDRMITSSHTIGFGVENIVEKKKFTSLFALFEYYWDETLFANSPTKVRCLVI